jgi:hypothetical protein
LIAEFSKWRSLFLRERRFFTLCKTLILFVQTAEFSKNNRRGGRAAALVHVGFFRKIRQKNMQLSPKFL